MHTCASHDAISSLHRLTACLIVHVAGCTDLCRLARGRRRQVRTVGARGRCHLCQRRQRQVWVGTATLSWLEGRGACWQPGLLLSKA